MKKTQQAEVDKHEMIYPNISDAHNKRGDFNVGIRDEHIHSPLSSKSYFNSTPTAAQNDHPHMNLTPKTHGVSSGDTQNNENTKQNQNFDKLKNKDASKKTSGESNDKVKSHVPEDNKSKGETSSTQKNLPEVKSIGKETMATNSQASNTEPEISRGRTLLPISTRQLTNPFENPILTYLTKQRPLDGESHNSDSTTKENKVNTPQHITREVFHQQTIINPNPYLHQFLQQQNPTQQKNPVYYQVQYPIVTQQSSSLPITEALTYPEQVDSSGNTPQTVAFFQGQNNQNVVELNRAEVPQVLSNPGNSGNSVTTTVTLYPAIASVMYTAPSASSVPQLSSTYQPQVSSPYILPFVQHSFRSIPSPMNLANSGLLYNAPQPSSRVQWPFSQYFPIVIKDPFLSMYNMLTSMIEYGPAADVCKKTNFRQGRSRLLLPGEDESITKSDEEVAGKVPIMENESWREIGKNENSLPVERKMPDDMTSDDKEENGDEERKKKDDGQNTEVIMETGGNGNAGPYITRLMVRKGGVSIAGPGGIATAGSGGTAIVGPGGVAYTSPNGLAVVGPGGKVVGLPSGADISAVTSQVTASISNSEGSTPRFLNIPPGGRIVATGPVVYYHPAE
jgi:hypothetical protein